MDLPILIISLADAHHRRAHLITMLEAVGLNYEIFDAVDARRMVPTEYEKYVDRPGMLRVLGRAMGTAEIGCALSHMMIYRDIVEKGLPGAIVFEDDAILSEADMFVEFLEQRIYERGDFFQLSHGAARVWRFGLGERRQSRRLRSLRLVHNSGLTTAYSISRKGAQYLLNCGSPIRCVADWPCDLRPLQPRIIVPKLVGRPPVGYQSDIFTDRSREKSSASPLRRQGSSEASNTKNPLPRGYFAFHRFLSKTVY